MDAQGPRLVKMDPILAVFRKDARIRQGKLQQNPPF